MNKTLLTTTFCLVASALLAQLQPYAPAPVPRSRVPLTQRSELSLPALPQLPPVKPESFIRSINLNGSWNITEPVTSETPFADALQLPDVAKDAWQNINVPLSVGRKYRSAYNKQRPYIQFWYKKTFNLDPKHLENNHVVLNFTRIGYQAEFFINGKRLNQIHKGDFTPCRLDITEAAKPGENTLHIHVRADMGPTLGTLKQATRVYGSQWSSDNIRLGLWGDVTLTFEPFVKIQRVLITPDIPTKSVKTELQLESRFLTNQKLKLATAVVSAMKQGDKMVFHAAPATGTLQTLPRTTTVTLNGDIKLWDVDTPNLYYLAIFVLDEQDKVLNAALHRFGFRDFKTNGNTFTLNGKTIFLFGENFASTRVGGVGRTTEDEEKYITDYMANMRANGYVMLRNAHQPIIPKVLEIADELGIMFFNEWGWSFTSVIDEEKFQENNLREVEDFLYETHNYPSVTMWSMGNEVFHGTRPHIARQLDKQVELMRKLDRHKRPISTFSGAAGWTSYGRSKLLTDVHDLHNYTSLSANWTTLIPMLDYINKGLQEIYGEKKLSRPLVDWENVGFSWGMRSDAKFRKGNIQDYLKYANATTTWGQPNGIGFTSCLPLHLVLSPSYSVHFPMSRYGRRIFELFRLDGSYAGFAPWFSQPSLTVATLWNQHLLPTIHNENRFPPAHLFANETTDWLFEISNLGTDAYQTLTVQIDLADEKTGNVIPVQSFPLQQPVKPYCNSTPLPFKLTLPKANTGFHQLRVTLKNQDKTIGMNYYEIFVQQRELVEKPVKPSRPVVVLDTNVPQNVKALTDYLAKLKIPYTVAKNPADVSPKSLMIVPPELETQLIAQETSEKMLSFVRSGGFLLILEQMNLVSSLPGNLSPVAYPLTFSDPVIVDHPIFKGLDWKNFDSWEDGDQRIVTQTSFVPFTINALCARGIRLGQKAEMNVGMSVLEATFKQGRILCSQLNAFKAIAHNDSSAASYLYNLFEYVCLPDDQLQPAYLLDVQDTESYVVNPKRTVKIDLAPYVNRSFSDDEDGDQKGGWTDQGVNDFSTMPLGDQTLAGIPFTVIDPAKNNDKSCLVLAGTERPYFPHSVKNIPLKGTFSRIFFLHTAAWGYAQNAGAYRFNYADGTTETLKLVGNQNIADWWNCATVPDARLAVVEKQTSRDNMVCAYVTEWTNPKPNVPLVSFDALSPLYRENQDIDWMPTSTAVPVLIAATAETAHPKRFDFLTHRYYSISGIPDRGKTLAAKASEGQLDGQRVWNAHFPPTPGGECPIVFFKFNPDPKNIADTYDYLTLVIKSDKPAIFKVSIPEKNWRCTAGANLKVIGDGKFHTYRLRVGKDLRIPKIFTWDTFRGELFFYYTGARTTMVNPPVNLVIKSATLE